MRALSLHQVIAPDAAPAELVRTANALGCEHVCLFTQGTGGEFPFPVVGDADVPELLRLMDGLGVSILGSTTFPLSPAVDVDGYAGGCVPGRRLGSRVANVRFLDSEQGRLADNFARLAELAGRYEIDLTIEFTGFGKREALDQALEVIRRAGRGRITIDPLHIVRTGTPLEALRRLDPDLIGYVQFCDGPLAGTPESYAYEGGFDRLPPGDGEFPLREILALTPPGMAISLEVPQEKARLRGVSVLERCRRSVDGMRRLIEDSESAGGAA
jgi:sugar phosphate isomerase/epimerase